MRVDSFWSSLLLWRGLPVLVVHPMTDRQVTHVDKDEVIAAQEKPCWLCAIEGIPPKRCLYHVVRGVPEQIKDLLVTSEAMRQNLAEWEERALKAELRLEKADRLAEAAKKVIKDRLLDGLHDALTAYNSARGK